MMKRLASCDSLGALISICPNSADMDGGAGAGEFQAMLEGGGEEVGSSEKKRRLTAEQVKALEKYFEVENKLEPDRKMKLAEEVGLQPRQVAVWFQNRRARWKTKQLERDYAVLKANHDALKLKFEALHRDNQSLTNQIEELRSKLNEEVTTNTINVKKEPLMTSGENFEVMAPSPMDTSILDKCVVYFGNTTTRDGPSDSDTSAILNEDNSSIVKLLDPCNNSVHIRVSGENGFSHMVKAEEHDFFAEEVSCTTFFSDDQPPCLNWYCSDSWN